MFGYNANIALTAFIPGIVFTGRTSEIDMETATIVEMVYADSKKEAQV